LAIIAYLGPVERHVVDYIRGVNSQVTLRNLQVRGLIEKKSNPRHPITPLYETTFDFLANLGLRDASALPEFERYQTIKASLVERSSSEHA
ncbi:MAG: SMC-Scp complex subunit ScpB, partial [Candidatus Colwellbacteria bacterium]|nr:SMC-Scp complex subunit ScpB [Candidatus Colwellbacteria bacterium]